MRDEVTCKEIIASIVTWAEDNEFEITFLGTEEDRHKYADAIVGTVTEPRPAVVYLRSKVIEHFMEEGMGEAEAEEWYEYNTVRTLPYIKEEEGRPIIVDDVIPF